MMERFQIDVFVVYIWWTSQKIDLMMVLFTGVKIDTQKQMKENYI